MTFKLWKILHMPVHNMPMDVGLWGEYQESLACISIVLKRGVKNYTFLLMII